MNFSSITRIISELNDRKRVLILQHKNPDGDSLGASLALGSMLTRTGHRVSLILPEKPPEYLMFLAGIKKIRIKKKVSLKDFDAVILIESQDFKRTGLEIETEDFFGPIILIDHHIQDLKDPSKFVLNEKSASSVSEIIYNFFKASGIPIKKEEAIAIFTGIYTDTGRFSEGNTTSQSLKIAAEFIDMDIDIKKIYQKLYGEKNPDSIKLLSYVLSTFEIRGKIGVIHLKQEILKRINATMEDTKNFLNYIRDVKGIDVAVFFREEKEGVRITFRSKKIDVYKIVKKIESLPEGVSGGGHKLAAGCFIRGNLAEVKEKILRLLEEWI